MNGLLRDLRHGARLLVCAPLFTLAATLTIALGVGATTAVLTVGYALGLRPLPLPEPAGLVTLSEVQEIEEGRQEVTSSFSYDRYREYESLTGGALRGLAAHHHREMALRADEGSRPVLAVVASENYFDVLGLRPAVGRFFGSTDALPASPAVVVLSHRLWTDGYGADPAVVGRTVVLDSRTYTVVGVAPSGFGGVYTGVASDVWVPVGIFRREHPGVEQRDVVWAEQLWLSLFGRLDGDASLHRVAGHLSAGVAGREVEPSWGGGTATVRAVRLEPLKPIPEWMWGATLGFSGMILLTAVLVLLIGASNVAGMLLARATARRREIAIRLALCAGRGRVVRQLLTESLLLFAVGGVAGLLLAFEGTRMLARILPGLVPGIPLQLDLQPDLVVLAAAGALLLVTAAVFGAAPALQATSPDLTPGLRDVNRPGPLGTGGRLRGGLVVVQLSLSLVLLLGAGLFIRAAREGATVEPGFDVDRLVVASLNLAPHGYDEAQGRAFYHGLVERLEADPAVERASLAQFPHLSGNVARLPLSVPGSSGGAVQTSYSLVDAGWFETVGTPILEGRGFEEADRSGGVVVVNEVLAELNWPGELAVGRVVVVDGVAHEVVGVARNVHYESLMKPPPPHLYVPFGATWAAAMTIHVRAVGEPAAALPAVYEVVQGMDPDLTLRQAGTFRQRIGVLLLPQRLASVVIGIFGLVGLALAATGIFGLLAFHVEQQHREIAVRIAMGGRAADVMWVVLKRAALLVAAGTALGIGAASGLAPLIERFLFGVSAWDPIPMVAGSVVLVCVALLASWIPLRRALRVDPMALLRTE